jgi:hypothetical protein
MAGRVTGMRGMGATMLSVSVSQSTKVDASFHVEVYRARDAREFMNAGLPGGFGEGKRIAINLRSRRGLDGRYRPSAADV